MRLNPATIAVPRLLDSLSIAYERDGDRLKARCPSGRHPDASPSWDIGDAPGRPENGLHHCWSCSWGGDAPRLVCHALGVGFQAAYAWIREFATGAAVPAPVSARVVVGAIGIVPFGFPPGVVEDRVVESWPAPPRRYLEKRGIPAWQVARWRLAYALEGRLRGRIVLPVRDQAHRLQSYTARAFDGAPVRYLTPRKEEGASPAAVFGSEHWKGQSICIVAEAAIDSLACERVCPGCAVAALGSGGASNAAQPYVVLALARFRRLVVVTDPDAAGDRAAASLDASLGRHLEVMRARPPAGKDAAAMGDAALGAMLAPLFGLRRM